MNREMYYLWLTNIMGIGNKSVNLLLEYFEEPENIFYAKEQEIRDVFTNHKGINKVHINNLLKSRDIHRVRQDYNQIIASNIKILTIEDERYPEKLKNIYDPPIILYYKGSFPIENKIKIAIVGSRKCSGYGKKIAEYFARELGKHNICIVSGMARGIDTMAHQGALTGKGETVAVLGSGINVCYPKENIHLMRNIIKSGCVVSEYPINAAPIAGNFPRRNRIISGLCDGVLIVEAAQESGSLITADFALEQGRDVFSVPGRIFDSFSEGTNNLIKMGAKLVTSVEDILEEYNIIDKEASDNSNELMNLLDDTEKIVYNHILLEKIHIDDLCRKTKLSINDISVMLLKLELNGMIKQLANKYYIRNL